MADIPRLNGVIRALETGKPAFTSFCQADPETATAMSTAKYDGIVYEMEHNPWDIRALRDSLQYMLNRGQIAKSGSVAAAVTPMVRIPPNGAEKAQFHAKQALDLGAYGIVWPHISSVEEAHNAVAACRYPRLKSAPLYEPAGIRGDGPTAAVRYWGLSQQDYYARADVWPLNPKGEVLVILMMEDTRGIEALPVILQKVSGIGAILIGEGDLSQELGYPRQYEHPEVLKWMARVVETCKRHNVVVGQPHVDANHVGLIRSTKRMRARPPPAVMAKSARHSSPSQRFYLAKAPGPPEDTNSAASRPTFPPFRCSIATISPRLRSRSASSASPSSAQSYSCAPAGIWRRPKRWHTRRRSPPRLRSIAPMRCYCPSRKSWSHGRRRPTSPKSSAIRRS